MRRALLVLLAFLAHGSPSWAASDVHLWHSLDAGLAAQLERLVREYNASQSEFRVRVEPLDKAPMAKTLQKVSVPLNTARPVLYYNRDALLRARLSPSFTPKTWYEMASVLGALADSGQSCAYTTAWPAWVMLENSGGAFSRQLMVRWTSMLATWEKSGYFSYSGRSNEAEARFAAGECAVLSSSSESRSKLLRRAPFWLGVAPLPYYDDAGVPPGSLPEASPAVWVEHQSVGLANFFAFLAGRAAQGRRERELMEEQIEAVWRGSKTAPDALNAYSSKLR